MFILCVIVLICSYDVNQTSKHVREAGEMPDFERLYHILFNAMTDALRKLEAGEPLEAARLLMEAQRRTEELYIEA